MAQASAQPERAAGRAGGGPHGRAAAAAPGPGRRGRHRAAVCRRERGADAPLPGPYLAHAWAERGADLRVQAPGQSKKVALTGALDADMGELIVSASPTKVSADFIALLRRLDWHTARSPAATACLLRWCWTTAPSTPARPAGRRWTRVPGSRSSGCRGMPPS